MSGFLKRMSFRPAVFLPIFDPQLVLEGEVRVAGRWRSFLNTDLDSIILSCENPTEVLREQQNIKSSEAIRVLYFPGPGDVAGTFEHWRAKRHDPRVPIISYSLMFYELMAAMDTKCQVISMQPVDRFLNSITNQFQFSDILPKPFTGRWSYYLSQYSVAKSIIKQAKEFDPHIVIVSTHAPSSVWRKLSKNRILVLTAHNTFWNKGGASKKIKSYIYRSLLKLRASALNGAICTSHECARQISDLTGGRVSGEVACPQIVQHYPIQRRSRVQNLLFLGRIEVPKGVFFLLDAFELLADGHPELTLTLAGSGEAESELVHRISQSDFSARIKFCGRLDSYGVHDLIAVSDLIVCPTMTTFNEGLAVVGFEAAAHGIPTLISSVVPAAELLGNSCTVFEADELDSIVRKLSNLITDPEFYNKRCAATSDVRRLIYDRSLSWGSGLFRALLSAGKMK